MLWLGYFGDFYLSSTLVIDSFITDYFNILSKVTTNGLPAFV